MALKGKSFMAALTVLMLARACALSNTVYGNLIRYHHAVDPDVLMALITVMNRDRETHPLELDDTAALNVVAACDITRKMFASDELDEIMKDQNVPKFNANARDNVIDFSNFLIKDILRNGTFRKEIEELLSKLEETIQP